jgi:hypothetical protein
MIIGLGDLASWVLEFLAREQGIPRIVAASRTEDTGYRRTNSAVIGASHLGRYPDIEFVQLDAANVGQTAELIYKVQPSVIVNGMTLKSWWWVISQLSVDTFKQIDEANLGPWFPMHFPPAYRLMRAVKQSGVQAKVINCAFPDVVNAALAKIGLAPTVGIGNVDIVVGALRVVAAKTFNVSLRSVAVFLACAHYTSYNLTRFGNSGGSPLYLKVIIDDKDITPELNIEQFLQNMTSLGRRPGGTKSHAVVASSVCKIVRGMLFDTKEIGHAPGPNGLPGGYPIKINADGVEIFLPEGLSLETAVQINEEGNRLDGIETIQADGTVVVTEKSASIMKSLLGFSRRHYTVDGCEDDYQELLRKFTLWAEKARFFTVGR